MPEIKLRYSKEFKWGKLSVFVGLTDLGFMGRRPARIVKTLDNMMGKEYYYSARAGHDNIRRAIKQHPKLKAYKPRVHIIKNGKPTNLKVE